MIMQVSLLARIISIILGVAATLAFAVTVIRLVKPALRFCFAGQAGPAPRSAAPRHMLLYLALALLALRLAQYALSYGAVQLAGAYPGYEGWARFARAWTQWDAMHYLHIAEHGYQRVGEDMNLIVFFPLYPLLVRLLHAVIPDYFASALVLSYACSVGAAWFFYQYVRLKHAHRVACWAVAFLFISPAAFFTAAPYTEALFLLLTFACLYCARRGAWLLCGLCGMLAACTRNVGVLLILPCAMEAFHQMRTSPRAKRGVWCLFLIPLGLAAYCALNYAVLGDPFRFMFYQSTHWGQRFGFFATTLRTLFEAMLAYRDVPLRWILWGPEFFSSVIALSLLCWQARSMRPSDAAFALCYYMVVISATNLLSAMRYLMVLYPLYIAFAQCRPRARWALAAGSCALMCALMCMYCQGMMVY
nr:mannosyltransferase family protein [Maliibacterium massiliense]